MLTIRSEQMEVLGDYARQLLETRLSGQIRTMFPELLESLSDSELRAFVASGIDRAISYEVVLEEDVRRYLEYAVRYGGDFDRAPATSWAEAILSRTDLEGTEKMNELDDFELFVLGGGKA